MANTFTPHKRRWWLLPLVLVVLAGLVIVLRPTITQWSWERASSREFSIYDMDATSENNIVLAGAGILRYNGLWWQHITYPQCQEVTQAEENVSADPIIVVEDIEIWNRTHIYAACGTQGILRYNGLWWQFMPIARNYSTHCYQLWTQSSKSIYAIDEMLGLLHSDGRIWNKVSLPDGFNPSYVGGNDEYVVVLEENQEGLQDILVQSDDVWNLVDIQPLLMDVEPDNDCINASYCEYSLYPNKVWALEDGRIIVRVCQEIRLGVVTLRSCPLLLCYQDEDWSTIESPNDSFYPTHIMADDQRGLLVYGAEGDRYRQIVAEEGSGWAWQEIEGKWPGRILGFSTLLDTSNLLVYGGEPIPTDAIDIPYTLEKPFELEHYELTW